MLGNVRSYHRFVEYLQMSHASHFTNGISFLVKHQSLTHEDSYTRHVSQVWSCAHNYTRYEMCELHEPSRPPARTRLQFTAVHRTREYVRRYRHKTHKHTYICKYTQASSHKPAIQLSRSTMNNRRQQPTSDPEVQQAPYR